MATPGNAKVRLSWTVPANGEAEITAYAIKGAADAGDVDASTSIDVDVADIPGGTEAGQTVFYDVTMLGDGTPLANGTEYFFKVAAVNGIGTGAYPAAVSATPAATEQLSDEPSLIEVTTLDQLNAIRYDLDGDGAPDGWTSDDDKAAYRTAFSLAVDVNNVCLVGCAGYQLMNNLDFNDADGSGAVQSPRSGPKTARLTAFQARRPTATQATQAGRASATPVISSLPDFMAMSRPSATSTSIDRAIALMTSMEGCLGTQTVPL